MKISALLEGRKRLDEGGNLSINGKEAQHLDLKVTKRSYMVPKLNELLYAIDAAYTKMYKQPLWGNKILASGKFLSGSSLHFFNVKGISDEVFTEKKPTVGDIDTMVDKTKEPNLQQFLTAYTNKQIGAATFLGFQRGNEQFSGLFELQDPPVKVQIDFEFVEFEKDNPTDWARFSHSSAWEDLQAGVKGVFHKWLIQAFTALTRKNFILRKMKGRGKLRQEVDEPATDNMYSFAVSSKEGGGLRAKYEPVLDDNGNPLVIKGLPVMREAPTSGYNQDIGQIFSTILDQRLNPKQAQALQTQFWSFTGLLQVMNTLLTTAEKEQVMQGFLKKTIGAGAQGMYKNNPDKDIAEKTLAINTLLNTLKLPKPADLDQQIDAYRKAYKYSEAGTDAKATADADVVKSMAKNTLAEAIPSYKRKGIQHIYNPGSSTEMKDADFINFCKEIAHDGGNFASVPINLKVDGAGIRFGRTQNGEPFFMTSRVETPMTKANIGDFEKYGRSQGQSDEQLARTQNYDKALSTIVNADFMKDIPPDTIVQAEMLFNPMAQQDSGGYKFVNIPYDPKKLGKVMTLVPISVKQYSTGEQSPDAAKIKEALIKDSTPNIKMVNNTLSHKGIDVSKIVNPIVKNSEALLNAVSQRGDNPDKQKAKAILSAARQALSKSIINSPIPGKDQLGDMIEGLVINMPSGTLAKVTSPDMQQKMADKQAMNKKPTEGGNRTTPAVITYGSFVGHKGHEQLIDQTIGIAKQVGGVPFIYVSPVVGPDDPVPPADKVKTLQKLYPQYANNIQVWDSSGTAMKKIEKELVLPANSPYNKIIVVVGADRKDSTESWLNSLEKRMKDPVAIAKYGGTQNQVEFQTVGTERDPSKGGTGISFTQLRDKLKDPNASEQDKLNFWMQAFDSQKLGAEWIKHLMDTTAKYSNNKPQAIKEYIAKMRPLLKEATVAQQYKMLKLMKEAYKHTNEDLSRRGFLRGAGAAAALGATALGSQASEVPQSQSSMEPVIIAVVTLEDGTTKTYNLGTKFKSAKEAEQFLSNILDKQGLSYSLDIKRGYPKTVNEYTVRNTKKFIQRAHDTEQGQKYGSAPYSSHPKAVANIGKKFFGTQFTPEAVKVALLHDVLEDTPYTPPQLAKKGFSKDVIQAVQLLTKNKNLSYADNIKNIIDSGNKLAMMVKYSDNYMNFNGDKSHWDSEKANHSNKKYLASLNMLGDVLGIKKHLGNEESNVTESTDYLEEK